MQPFQHKKNLIGTFAQHKVAANLLMLIMLLAGIWALNKLNTQFFPNFALDIISVRVIWRGATAEDVQESITRSIEQALRSLDEVRKMTSTSANGVSSVTLEYEEGSDMGAALDRVKEEVSLLRNLPQESEKPEISLAVRYDSIARLLITGPDDLNELRHLVRRIEHELLERGISKIDISGLPEEEISIQVSSARLEELGLTVAQIGQKVKDYSRDIPAGTIGRNEVSKQLRSLEQRRTELAFTEIPLIADQSGRLVKLGDVATVERRARDGEVRITYQGKPAVELRLQRAESSDALEAAKVLQTWLAETPTTFPPTVKLHVYDERWQYIKDRISLLLRNGSQGLILVVITLFLFLNARVAFWVAAGIPISLMGMLTVLYLVGGSINMISLFAMIMALGIVVDDAIVVGEDAFAHFQTGEKPLLASEGGAQRMLAPVVASSLTTVSAFLPLMLIGGHMGNILFDIPVVMVCVIIASVIECFFVLPGHLRHTFHKIHDVKPSLLRRQLEKGFDRFRDNYFRSLTAMMIDYRWVVVSGMLTMLVLAIGLLVGGRLSFTFFPSPEGNIIMANASFVAGTPLKRVDEFLVHLEETLAETDKALGNIVKTATVLHGTGTSSRSAGTPRGDQFGSILVELSSADSRKVRNKEFVLAWQAKVRRPAGLESLTISEQRSGPPGQDIEIRLAGDDAYQIKRAALDLAEVIKTRPGVSAIEDDMPYGQEQWIYKLTPQGKALGLTIESVGSQLRAAFDGYLAQIFQDGDDEVEVRVSLSNDERYQLNALDNLTLRLPSGESVPFYTAVKIENQQGFEALRHIQGRLSAQVLGDVDNTVTNSNKILAHLEKNFLPELTSRYGLEYSLEGRAADQAEALGDMRRGMLFALAMIYLILAWQFASYGWPLIVMSIIPFGLVGALVGHWLMGLDLTILSLFGFFGLSGIVINDSIVLITFYRQLREEGMPIREALIEAACQRLRAVLLTSLTTIFGLMPLLFETSLQAQFLIPMATSIAFGLIFSTVLVLLAVPALLAIYERVRMPKEDWLGTGVLVEKPA